MCVCVRVCEYVCMLLWLGEGIKPESKINQCHVVCMSTAVVSLPSPIAVISKLQWPHVKTHTHTMHRHTKRTDASVCHCISKCLDNAQKERVGQMLSWHKKNNLHLSASDWSNSLGLIYFLLLSVSSLNSYSSPQLSLLSPPPTISSHFLFHPLPLYSLFIPWFQTLSNPESQWVCKLMQRICEELGIQLEKIRLLSFQPDI